MNKSPLSRLSVARKADRAQMATAIYDLATRVGCTAQIEVGAKDRFPDERTTMVRIEAPGGLRVNVELSGSCPLGNQHLLHWNMSHGSENLLAPGFAPSMNTVHYCKATDFAADFAELLQVLESRLRAAVDGTAYMDPADAAAHKTESRRRYDAMVARSLRPTAEPAMAAGA